MIRLVVALGWFVVVAFVLGARRTVGVRRLRSGVEFRRPTGSARRRVSWSRRTSAGDELPGLLDDLARALRSGFSLRQSLLGLPLRGALAEPTERLQHELEFGQPIGAALDRWVDRIDDPLVELAGAALALVVHAGGSGADAIDRVAATLRDRRALELEIRAQASQARASAFVIALLPVGFLALAASADPSTLDFLMSTATGVACLLAGLALAAVGLWWMHRITEAVRW